MPQESFEREHSPSRKITKHHLGTLSDDYSKELGIHKDLLRPLLEKSFIEKVGSEIYFRPQSLPFIYRALQLEGKLSNDPATLRIELQNTYLMIVDVANLKKINEMPGSSHETGDAAINLHTRAVMESTTDEESSHCLVRFMGDEFADYLNNPKNPHSEKEIRELIKQKTEQLIQEAKIAKNHPLNNLATHHPELINQVIQFAKLKDINLSGDIHRMDDMVEAMFAATEEAQGVIESSPNLPPNKQVLATIKDLTAELLPPVQSQKQGIIEQKSALDLIVQAIEGTNFSSKDPTPELIAKNESRIKIIKRYLPKSLQDAWKNIELAKIDSNKTPYILTLFEEALFNMQFSRNPPILNEWVFNELALENQDKLNVIQMTSTPFAKLYNTLINRLATTSLLKKAAKNTLNLLGDPVGESEEPSYIIKKQGASFYILSTQEQSEKFRSKIKKYSKDVIEKIASSSTIQEFFQNTQELLFYTPISYAVKGRETYYQTMDKLRQTHYLGELVQILRACRDHNNQNVANLLLYFISERALDRLDIISNKFNKLQEIATLFKNSFKIDSSNQTQQ